MRNEITKILHFKRFFQITESNKQNITYKLEIPSIILMQNIHTNWLQSILSKTNKHFPVFLNNKFIQSKEKNIPFGFINDHQLKHMENEVFEHNFNRCQPKDKCVLRFNLIVPEQDTMQYFVQWQRYRKFWWSSITTTPSLFTIGDIKNGDNTSEVNIVAKFPWGPEAVERLTMEPHTIAETTSHLSCVMSAEKALLTLLLDGHLNSTKEGYLRLHRKMAPFKISFVLDEASKNMDTLKELARLLSGRLVKNKISTWIPDFNLTSENQLKENLQMGVAYTAVLSEDTLNNGIFHLLNSSTMLKEQVHVADFDSYAALVFEN